MLRGLYISASSLVAKTETLDVTSNNLANAQTTGYKKDFVTYEPFENVLISKINGQYRNDELTQNQIDIRQNNGEYTMDTKNGYFEVNSKNGISHHKSVEFHKDADGYLSTFYLNSRGDIIEGMGYRLQGQNGDINVGDSEFEIDDLGQVLVGGQVVDQLIHNYSGNIIGTMSGGIRVDRVVTDFEQGELAGTSNPLDFAIDGEGFFTIETPNGTRYSRGGNFKLNADYELVTNEGYNVVGFDGPIVLGDGEISVNDFGEITMDGEIIDKFAMVNPKNIQDMHKEGLSLYSMDGDLEDLGFEGQVRQRFIENSNINTVNEMINMITLYRNYESNQKLVTTYDGTLDKVINEVGVV